ncbi:YheC/YheD family protein [Texcoconibacillus texcoconensis]|uniref:YheC/YheD family protein n=1 Tax=Texcoconibacillus texcoconensis TaxID=1095777 RepID=A0A840QPI7_9BACI|nr:YheC/YheD family protein [Texcoconibacillus texcoconensis]MBB5173258.1 hypothetical protein [Texcoconibacillus texcoconensis]
MERSMFLHFDKSVPQNTDLETYWRISPAISKAWHIENEQTVTITIGRFSKIVTCFIDSQLTGNVVSYPPVSFDLCFNPTKVLSCYFHEQKRVQIGPIFSVIVPSFYEREFPVQRTAPFIEELAQVSMKMGIGFYVFQTKDISTESVHGFTWSDEHGWIQGTFPFPDVSYNRLTSRKSERKRHVQKQFQLLKSKGTCLFNDSFINKSTINEILQNEDCLTPYVPDTRPIKNEEDLYDMLSKYDELILKPIDGHEGKGIFLVRKRENALHVTYPSHSQYDNYTFSSKQSFFKAFSNRLNYQSYIAQQHLHLQRLDGRSIDYRLLCIKDQTEAWNVVSGVARIANWNSIVSNLSKGGEKQRIKDVLDQLFPEYEAKHAGRMLIELATASCKTIDAYTRGTYAELGIDLAFDVNGHPWFIEANTKPSKQSFGETEATIRPSARHLVQYARFLAMSSTFAGQEAYQ